MTGAPPISAVGKGVSFEVLVKAVLERFSFHVTRKGGAGDLGIDLQGIWQVAPVDRCVSFLNGMDSQDMATEWPIVNIIAQCKHEKKVCKPSYIRELDGVVSRWASKENSTFFIPQHLTNETYKDNTLAMSIPIIGIIVCSAGFSPACLSALHQSNQPLLCMTIDATNPREDYSKENDIWYQKRLLFCQLNATAHRILPNLHIATTFSSGTSLDQLPSVCLFNDTTDLSSVQRKE